MNEKSHGLTSLILWKSLKSFNLRSPCSCISYSKVVRKDEELNVLALAKKELQMTGALFLWLWEQTHIQKIVGSNPSTIYWTGIFLIIFCNRCIVCLKKTENTLKRGRARPIFNEELQEIKVAFNQRCQSFPYLPSYLITLQC